MVTSELGIGETAVHSWGYTPFTAHLFLVQLGDPEDGLWGSNSQIQGSLAI